MTRRIWIQRTFTLGLPTEAFPDIRERVRGTPTRLEERLGHVPSTRLVARPGEAWSIQEHAGHLADLEPLWAGRLDELLAGAAELRAADMTNRVTREAGHNTRPLAEVLTEFRAARTAVLRRLDALDETALTRTALHPRLQQPMSIVDLFFFVAEHDDHHLATVTDLLR